MLDMCVYKRLTAVCCSPDDKMLCAGFEESQLMMWSLTPQPLPCRRDSADADSQQMTAGDHSDSSDEPQRRFLCSVCLCNICQNLCLPYSSGSWSDVVVTCEM